MALRVWPRKTSLTRLLTHSFALHAKNSGLRNTAVHRIGIEQQCIQGNYGLQFVNTVGFFNFPLVIIQYSVTSANTRVIKRLPIYGANLICLLIPIPSEKEPKPGIGV